MHTLHIYLFLKLLSFATLFFTISLTTLPAFGDPLSDWDRDVLKLDAAALVIATTDYPKPGLTFLNLENLVGDPQISEQMVEYFVKKILDTGEIDAIAGVAGLGWIIGPRIAARLGVRFIPFHEYDGPIPRELAAMAPPYNITNKMGYPELRALRNIGETIPSDKPRLLIFDDIVNDGKRAMSASHLAYHLGFKPVAFAFIASISELGGIPKLVQASFDRNNIIHLLDFPEDFPKPLIAE